MKTPKINEAQFLQDLTDLAKIGRQPDGAVHRVAYSPADLDARQWINARLRQLGLEPAQDAAGNTSAIYSSSIDTGREDLPPIAIGSHSDTVPMGGAYDGALGVVAALAVIEALHTADLRLRHPLELINFAAEEATMAGGTTGSQAMTGVFDMAILDKNAWDGRPVRAHLLDAGLSPEQVDNAERAVGSMAAFVELHIEQSNRLEQANVPIAIVDGFVGIRRYAVRFSGTANHAGTTPMAGRDDALIHAAPLIHFVRDVAVELGIVGTIGDFNVHPGAANVIPERVEMTVEIRGLDDTILDQAEEIIRDEAEKRGGAFEPIVLKEVVPTAEPIRRAVAAACAKLGLETLIMPSGAGHDAMNMERLCPQGIFFVPSRAGISHSKDEYTSPEECLNGARVYLETVLALDELL